MSTDTSPTNGTYRATTAELIRIHGALVAVLSKAEDDLWAYKDGYTDKKVAKELGLKEASVRKVRRDVFGDLRKHRPVGRYQRITDVASRLADLEERMKIVEEMIAPTRKAAE